MLLKIKLNVLTSTNCRKICKKKYALTIHFFTPHEYQISALFKLYLSTRCEKYCYAFVIEGILIKKTKQINDIFIVSKLPSV